MTLRLMKALAHDFSMTSRMLAALGAGLALAWAPSLARAEASCAQAAGPLMPPDLVAAAAHPKPYPSFCDIPPTPVVPPPAHYRAAVVDTRLAGAELVRDTGASN